MDEVIVERYNKNIYTIELSTITYVVARCNLRHVFVGIVNGDDCAFIRGWSYKSKKKARRRLNKTIGRVIHRELTKGQYRKPCEWDSDEGWIPMITGVMQTIKKAGKVSLEKGGN